MKVIKRLIFVIMETYQEIKLEPVHMAQTRAEFIEEFYKARQEMLDLIGSFASNFVFEDFDEEAPEEEEISFEDGSRNKILKLKRVMGYVRDTVEKKIHTATPKVPPITEIRKKGGQALYQRLGILSFRPSLEGMSPEQFHQLIGEFPPDSFVDILFNINEWKMIRAENKMINSPAAETEHVKRYYLYRAIMNTFLKAGIEVAKSSNLSYDDPQRTAIIYEAAAEKLCDYVSEKFKVTMRPPAFKTLNF